MSEKGRNSYSSVVQSLIFTLFKLVSEGDGRWVELYEGPFVLVEDGGWDES